MNGHNSLDSMDNGFSLPSVSVGCQKNDYPLPPPLGGRLKFSILSSGSGGNSVYIEADGKRILIDAGLSEKKLSQRMAHIDRSLNGLDAVFATHEHTDHIRGMGPLLRKHQLSLYTTEGTYKRACHSLGKLPGFTPVSYTHLTLPTNREV